MRTGRRWRLSLRAQLTLLYAGPFLLVGAVLLTVPLLGVQQSVPVGSKLEPAVRAEFPFDTWAQWMAVLLVASVGLGWLVAGRFVKPLQLITAAAREISATNLHRRLGPTGGSDELAELAATLDGLFARLEASFESQRNFVANASHELRTPLTAERTVLQVALADPEPTVESLQAACREVLDLGAAQERLIDALLTLAASEGGVERREVFDLADVVRQVVAATPGAGRTDSSGGSGGGPDGARPDPLSVSVSTELGSAPMSGDRDLVQVLVANLIDNAVRHNLPSGGGGTLEITTATTAAPTAAGEEAGKPGEDLGDDRRGARISVSNSGPVVPADDLERLFQPFQQLERQRTTHGEGHGLGLAIVRAIATAHGAHLVTEPRPSGGLEVTVTFAERPGSGPAGPPPGGPRRQ